MKEGLDNRIALPNPDTSGIMIKMLPNAGYITEMSINRSVSGSTCGLSRI